MCFASLALHSAWIRKGYHYALVPYQSKVRAPSFRTSCITVIVLSLSFCVGFAGFLAGHLSARHQPDPYIESKSQICLSSITDNGSKQKGSLTLAISGHDASDLSLQQDLRGSTLESDRPGLERIVSIPWYLLFPSRSPSPTINLVRIPSTALPGTVECRILLKTYSMLTEEIRTASDKATG